jgi:predicted  nucleic acid-binding Zn-ribbon protein
MPHICTRCNNVFDSGEDILKGCPNCGWKKFMFVKKGMGNDRAKTHEEQIITRAMGVRRPPKAKEVAEEAHPNQRHPDLKAHHTKVSEFTKAPDDESHDGPHASHENDESNINIKNQPEGKGFDGKPAGKTLESIKITAPGTYELNLPSLFERDELIMAVKEGTYFIDLTSAFKKSKKD